MIATIHQPDFLPWLGFFNKAVLCDTFVIADHVQYRDDGFQNRNRIKTAQGSQWLTVPVVREYGLPIYKVKVSTHKQGSKTWKDLHLMTIQRNYAKAPYYSSGIKAIEEIYRREYTYLYEYNIAFIESIFSMLGISPKVVVTHDMDLKESKTNSVIEICRRIGADSYISGIRGTRYIEDNHLSENNIRLLFNNYEHPTYNQQFMKLGFVPNMSVIDLLFNYGHQSLDILKSGFRGFELKSDNTFTDSASPSTRQHPEQDPLTSELDEYDMQESVLTNGKGRTRN